jgi:hypothetical protein
MGANAVTTVPVYVAGEVLTAADLNITNSGIPVFAGTTERDAAFGGTGEKTLAEGQFAYLESTNALQYYDSASWVAVGGSGVLQVKSTAKTDTFTTTSATFVDVTSLSVSITPTSASNKILILATVNGNGNNGVNGLQGQLVRDSTAIALGDAAGVRTPVSFGNIENNDAVGITSSIMFLDSPATTSATTYKIQVRSNVSGQPVNINRLSNNGDSATLTRSLSTITVMEVAP